VTGRVVGIARGHPRHLVLAGAVAGLLASPGPRPLGLALAAVGAAVAGRTPLALLVAGATLAAGALGTARLARIDRTGLEPLLEREVSARAVVLEAPRRSRSGRRSVAVRLLGGRGGGERVIVRLPRAAGTRPPRFAHSGIRWPRVAVGAIVALRGRLERLAPWERFERRRGAHAALDPTRVRATGSARGGPAGLLDGVRRRAQRGLSTGLDPPEAALLRGMVLGEDEAIAEPVREEFRRSGLAHLLAVSGQNVMLLAALALPLAAALGLPLRARLLAVLGLIALYVPLAGAGPSIQRAGVMGAAGLIATLASRPASRWYALLLAAAITLAISPHAADDPGWQLSFAAVVGLLAWAPGLAERLRASRLPQALAEAVAITVAATLATAPLLAFRFERVSLASLPANLLAAPAVAPVMWLGMAAAAAGQASGSAAGALDALALYPLGWLEWIAHAAAAVPHAAVPVRIRSPALLAATYGALLGFVHWRPARRLAPALAALAALAVGVIALTRPPPPGPPGELTVSFLDVGQGDATLLQHRAAAVLVDAGPRDGPIVRRLQRAGVRRLDVLVVTHAQADHEGGAPAVLARYPVGLVLDGAAGATTPGHRALVVAARNRRVRRVIPDAGQVVRAGPLALEILWPRREPTARHAGEDPNQRAVVALVRDGAFRALLPADAESDVTAALGLPRVDVLKVAHHGSADPGLPSLLTRLHPALAAIEVGRGNPYGHPASEALAALRAVPRIVRTDRDGTARVTVTPRGLRVQVHR
jgi:competence protein ComEC